MENGKWTVSSFLKKKTKTLHETNAPLSTEIKELGNFWAFDAVRIDAVGITYCRHDLNTENSDEHASEWTTPVSFVSHRESEDEETGRYEDCTCPQSLESCLWWWAVYVSAFARTVLLSTRLNISGRCTGWAVVLLTRSRIASLASGSMF